MDSPPKLTGETLIVHHIPLVHCQVPDRQCYSAGKRTNPFCQPDLGIKRTTSLPERDVFEKDALCYKSLIQPSAASVTALEDPEIKPRDAKGPVSTKRYNPFLVNDSQEQDIFTEGTYQNSFHLHSNTNVSKDSFQLHDLALQPFHLHDIHNRVKQWTLASRSGIVDGQEVKCGSDGRSRIESVECMDLDAVSSRLDSASTFSIECGDQEWNQSPDESLRNNDVLRGRTCSCSSMEMHQGRCYNHYDQCDLMEQQMGYISDSSCNSSDGVLVNFSALYNKMNGHSKSNLNSANLSCDSSFCSHADTGAFYLDLHSSPTDPKPSCESQSSEGSGKGCECLHQSSPALDANCNSYHLQCEALACPSENSDHTSCFQSQARLVTATQNYYKLVTCDLSSQSSSSPAGSSITSCSEDHPKSSPSQPTEYYLFRKPEGEQENVHNERNGCSKQNPRSGSAHNLIEGQVYVNISPPNINTGRQRSRSYDRNLDRNPQPRLGSLERMMSCPVKLSEGRSICQMSPPKRVTSFAELAKTRKKNGNSPPQRTSADSSLEFSPISERQKGPLFQDMDGDTHCQSLPPMPFFHCLDKSPDTSVVEYSSGGSRRESCSSGLFSSGSSSQNVSRKEQLLQTQMLDGPSSSVGSDGSNHMMWDFRTKAEGDTADDKSVVRYSKDQRPTTLPIQPFVLQHHFSKQLPKVRPLPNPYSSSRSQGYSVPSSQPTSQTNSSESQSSMSITSAGCSSNQTQSTIAKLAAEKSGSHSAVINDCYRKNPAPGTTRPSPLGSYSPIRSSVPFLQSTDSSSFILSPERINGCLPPRSRSCPVTASLLPVGFSPVRGSAMSGTPPVTEPRSVENRQKDSPKPVTPKERAFIQNSEVTGHYLHHSALPPLASVNLIVDKVSTHTESQRKKSTESVKQVIANTAAAKPLNGQSVKHLQSYYSDFFPDYFSVTEKPPAEFCLSPDGVTESVPVDLLQKKDLVKAINTAVDLIVAHFGTSRDPGVKAKLGNSSVSPNVGHLILKYLCPAIRDILTDGLKSYVLDMIIGQRKNVPWSVVEASTQLGPSTKVLHSLYCKISQYSELTNHTMRFNAFIFGLLNIRSLEFWFNYLYNHEDIILAHYQPTGFLALSHSVCQQLFEELLLLLQPLSLLPFDLDLFFEYHLQQMGKEQQKKKEQLRVKQDLLQSVHSTFQLMRTRGSGQESGTSVCSFPELQRADGEVGSTGIVDESEVKCERMNAVGSSVTDSEVEESQESERKMKEHAMDIRKDKQAGWWYQLMQSSQVYIEDSGEGSKFNRLEKRKKQGLATPATKLLQKLEGKSQPPPREGVVDGAEDHQEPEQVSRDEPKSTREKCTSKAETDKNHNVFKEQQECSKGKPSWMGSPPESVLHELKHNAQKENEALSIRAESQMDRVTTAADESNQGMKWGHLFGANPSQGRRSQAETRSKNRLPSDWLGLDKSVLQLMTQTVCAGKWREIQPGMVRSPSDGQQQDQQEQTADVRCTQSPPWDVKALCHHIATEKGQLSFKKGDSLRVLAKVDANWLYCSSGTEAGLVPLTYVTHTEDENC
ncbi:iporin isoform X2 [Protopterus annectens]|uniref:iporin isoform X2 n=1 Tax=Protopterus annectens TaxID=7888 RepID=UPI001CF9A6AE|nr:iporin isoform X2 [Protopterus annectens]